MTEIQDFGGVILVVACAGLLAVLSTKLTTRVPIPSPAIFLVTTAVASDLFPSLGNALSIRDVERDFTDVGWMQLWELSEVARELPRQLDHVLFVLCKPVTR